jgi:hypothetical protein
MKIVKNVGERLPQWIGAELQAILTFTGAGTALWTGSRALARLGWDWLGERFDPWTRLGVLAGGAYLLVYECWLSPQVVPFAGPIAAVAWCIGACWAAPPATVTDDKAAEPERSAERTPEAVYEATLDWIRRQIGDRQAVHLRDLLEHAQRHGMFEGLDVTTFRSHLERYGFPVKDKVRVRGLGVTVGIHRDDLPPLPEPLPDRAGQEPPDSELHAV